MSELVTDAMVEFAAATLYGERWDDVDESTRIRYRTVAAEMLTAAAPAIAAKALRDAAEDCTVTVPDNMVTRRAELGYKVQIVFTEDLMARGDAIERGES